MTNDSPHVHPAVRLLSSRFARGLFAPLMAGRTPVFMLHRVSDASKGIHGHSPAFVKAAIDALRSGGATIMSLRQLVDCWKSGTPVDRGAVVFTIDDGFADQATLVEQVFVPLQCPVTVFLISGFIDRSLWPWDDQLAVVFRKSPLESVVLDVGDRRFELKLGSLPDRERAAAMVRDYCKELPDRDPYDLVREIALQLDAAVPPDPPSEFMPMGWDRARKLEASGLVDFGPHSVSHRIFSRSSAPQARQEIATSWHRLEDELRNPLPVFAWPTGRPRDFSTRDIRIAKGIGLDGAVSTEPDYALNPGANNPEDFFRIRRFGLPGTLNMVLRYGSWLERARQLLPV